MSANWVSCRKRTPPDSFLLRKAFCRLSLRERRLSGQPALSATESNSPPELTAGSESL